VRQAEIDQGCRPGPTTEEQRRIAELERENRELRRANEILKSAAVFMWTARLCGSSAEWVGVSAPLRPRRTLSQST
jgi:transposase-like protein